MQGKGGDTQERREQSLNPFPACFTPMQGTQEGFNGLRCHWALAAPGHLKAGRASPGSVVRTNCSLFPLFLVTFVREAFLLLDLGFPEPPAHQVTERRELWVPNPTQAAERPPSTALKCFLFSVSPFFAAKMTVSFSNKTNPGQ